MVRPGKRLSVGYDMLRLPRVARPLRLIAIVLLALLLLPYAMTPFYAVVEPVSTVMLWRTIAGDRVQRMYAPLARISRRCRWP
jgi:hypothetical protein